MVPLLDNTLIASALLGFTPFVDKCHLPLGIQSGEIRDSALTASSMLNEFWGPERARVNNRNEGNYGNCWLSKTNDAGQWLQVDLGKISNVTRIATRGRFDSNQWVTSYYLSSSLDGNRFALNEHGLVCIMPCFI